jgi:hypothetical protein
MNISMTILGLVFDAIHKVLNSLIHKNFSEVNTKI